MEEFICFFCRKKHPLDPFETFCSECQEPLLCHFFPRKREFYLSKTNPLEKFLDFLPLSSVNQSLCLGEGDTPLVKLDRLMKKYDLPSVFVKNELFNPTGSFKDRGTVVAIQKAYSLGIERIGTVSTGNMASSTAAFGAKAGLRSLVLVKEDISPEKLLSAAVYGPVVIRVKGDYGELTYKSFSLGRRHNIYFMNAVDPFRIEGYKVIGIETFFQLNEHSPQYIFTPVSSGGHLIGLMRAFLDLKQQRLTQRIPTFIGVQAEGCSPIAQAFSSGKQKVQRIKKAETIAQAITNPDPPGGNMVLKMIREDNGVILGVSDRDILNAQKDLAELEGIHCLPASATALAGLLKLSKEMKFKKQDEIVLIITGTGLKALKPLEDLKMSIHHSSLASLDKTMETVLS